jgi:NADH-quinone oxidoreductase subunit I
VSRIREFWYTILSMLKGLWVTLFHLPKHAVTLRYPVERWEPPPRFRGLPVLIYDDDNDDFACVACMACQNICPVQCIQVTPATDPETGKRTRKMAEFRLGANLCMFCGLCVEACNFDAIAMSHRYEMASVDKPGIIFDKHALQQTPEEAAAYAPILAEIRRKRQEEKQRAAAERAAKPNEERTKGD